MDGLAMQKELQELGYRFEPDFLNHFAGLLADGQRKRFGAGASTTEEITRSTALTVLSSLDSRIVGGLARVGLDWGQFYQAAGLKPDELTPAGDWGAGLHVFLREAFADYASGQSGEIEGTPLNLAAALLVHVKGHASESGIYARLKESGARMDELPVDPTGFAPMDEPGPADPADRYVAWLCQFRVDNENNSWINSASPDAVVPWKTQGSTAPKDMQAGDSIIYWRADGKRKGSGGIVGTGLVESIEVQTDADGIRRLPTRVREVFPDQPISRLEAIEFAQIKKSVWRGSILDLTAEQALKLDDLLRSKDHEPLFPYRKAPPPDTLSEIQVRRDTPETEHDALGRAPLAVALAWRLHKVWRLQRQGEEDSRDADGRDLQPGFIAHVDSPWGGGKTTFANFVAQTLRFGTEKAPPEFLARLYPDRRDWSGLFLSKAHEKANLKNAEGRYRYPNSDRRPWIVVPFNAWLHQHVEPPWWCFYQEIRRHCFRAMRKEGRPLVVQDDRGEYATDPDPRADRIGRWLKLWTMEIAWRLKSPKVTSKLFVMVLSFLIGVVLLAFGGLEMVKGKAVLSTASDVGLIASFLTGMGAFVVAGVTVFTDALAPGRSLLGERVSLGSGDPLQRFRRHFADTMRRVGRPVLVVVDDLDRCRPEFIVELTRGLQTILLSPRVVYLILGDRKWIEQAFEVQNKDMNQIDVGQEHTFGGRFVEKAIQLSYSLPGIQDRQVAYVHEVLAGRSMFEKNPGKNQGPAGDETDTTAQTTNKRMQARRDVSQVKPGDLSKEQKQPRAGDTPPDKDEVDSYQKILREEAILNSAAKSEEVAGRIRHELEAISEYLPGNPRHIKRIINAISMYQHSLMLLREKGEQGDDLKDLDIGGRLWQELAIGVVLMMGFPKSWDLLTKHPELADCCVKKGKNGCTKLAEQIEAVKGNETVMNLLREARFGTDPQSPGTPVRIDSKAIGWLSKILPNGG